MANNIKDKTNEIRRAMLEAQSIAENFAKSAEQTSGEAQAAARNISSLFNKLAKQQGELLKNEQQLNKLKERELDLINQVKAAKEKDSKLTKSQRQELEVQLRLAKEAYATQLDTVLATEKELKGTKKVVDELTKKKGVWAEISKYVTESRVKLLGYLTSTVAIVNGLKGMAKAAQDVADIQIQNGSFLGMSGTFIKDMWEGSAAAIEWASNITSAKFALAGLGITGEETGAAFKQFSVLTQDASRQRAMTESIGVLSKALGVSFGEATEYAIEQTQKYNRTVESSAATLKALYEDTRKLNEGMGMTVIRGRDVAKLLFDISRESKAVAQDQKVMQSMISKNLIQLQSQGRNYQESLKSVSGYMKKLTVDAPDWAKILSSRKLGEQLKVLGTDTKVGKELEAELEMATPGIVARIKEIQQKVKNNTLDELTANRTIQEWLSETEVGMDAMQSTIGEIIQKSGDKANIAIAEMFGVGLSEANDMVDLNKAWNKNKQIMSDINADTEDSWRRVSDRLGKLGEDEKRMLKEDLTATEKMAFIRERITKNEKNALKDKKAKEQEDRNKLIKAYQERIITTSNEKTREVLQKKLQELKDADSINLNNIKKAVVDQIGDLHQWLGGGFVSQISEVLASPLLQIAGGVAAFLTMVTLQKNANSHLKLMEEHLRKISSEDSSGDDSFGGEGSGKGKKNKKSKKSKKASKKPVSKTGKALNFLKKGTGFLGKGLKKLGGPLASLGIEALLNSGSIAEAFSKGGMGGGMKSLFSNTVGNVGLGQAAGTVIGSIFPGVGTVLGGMAGAGVDSMLGDYNLNKLMGWNPNTVGKENVITDTPVANLPDTSSVNTANSTKTVGSPMVQSGQNGLNLSFDPFQLNGGVAVRVGGVFDLSRAIAMNNELGSMAGRG